LFFVLFLPPPLLPMGLPPPVFVFPRSDPGLLGEARHRTGGVGYCGFFVRLRFFDPLTGGSFFRVERDFPLPFFYADWLPFLCFRYTFFQKLTTASPHADPLWISVVRGLLRSPLSFFLNPFFRFPEFPLRFPFSTGAHLRIVSFFFLVNVTLPWTRVDSWGFACIVFSFLDPPLRPFTPRSERLLFFFWSPRVLFPPRAELRHVIVFRFFPVSCFCKPSPVSAVGCAPQEA